MLQPLVEPRQYAWFAHAEHLARAGIAASIGSVGDAYVNALMEWTICLFKTELIKPGRALEDALPGRARHRRVDRLVLPPPTPR
ncbi:MULTISPECIES: hypothetical protein [Streptomyces]|uniref:hypothetical protein n=1 Tax=Streptomyces TaxID=1883 RepID=UPI000A8943C6|nr:MULTISPECIES: hypothetical protein [Streptomyces]